MQRKKKFVNEKLTTFSLRKRLYTKVDDSIFCLISRGAGYDEIVTMATRDVETFSHDFYLNIFFSFKSFKYIFKFEYIDITLNKLLGKYNI